VIEHYSFGRVTFGGQVYTKDVIIHGDAVTSWRREKGHRVAKADIKPLVKEGPAVIVIGAGAYGVVKVPRKTREYIDEHGIRLIVKKTGEAVEEFNQLLAEKSDVAIAIHLTC